MYALPVNLKLSVFFQRCIGSAFLLLTSAYTQLGHTSLCMLCQCIRSGHCFFFNVALLSYCLSFHTSQFSIQVSPQHFFFFSLLTWGVSLASGNKTVFFSLHTNIFFLLLGCEQLLHILYCHFGLLGVSLVF